MFGNGILLVFVFSLFLGCAQPKYVREESLPSPEQRQNQNEADCRIQMNNSKLCLSWYWEAPPSGSSAGSLIFKIYRKNMLDQTAVQMDLSTLPTVLLWMPSMGHGSSPTFVERLDVGTYRATEVRFIMTGEWEIKFQERAGTQVRDEAIVSLNIQY